MKKEPSGNIAFDTGTLIEIVSGSEYGAYAKKLLQEGLVKGFVNEMNLGELRYMVCRASGAQKSEDAIKDIRDCGYFTISRAEECLTQAAMIKCARAISFLDCFPISLGETLGIPVLFATRECELQKEIKRRQFETEFLFLDEIVGMQKRQQRQNARNEER
jgi:predicted nucleic acid-binding protein